MSTAASIIIAILMIIIIIMAWCVCAVAPRDNRDDEDQLHYINEWKRERGM